MPYGAATGSDFFVNDTVASLQGSKCIITLFCTVNQDFFHTCYSCFMMVCIVFTSAIAVL